jgi:hypothetical protein
MTHQRRPRRNPLSDFLPPAIGAAQLPNARRRRTVLRGRSVSLNKNRARGTGSSILAADPGWIIRRQTPGPNPPREAEWCAPPM